MIKLAQQTRQTLTFFNEKQAYLQGPRQDMLSIKKTRTLCLFYVARSMGHVYCALALVCFLTYRPLRAWRNAKPRSREWIKTTEEASEVSATAAGSRWEDDPWFQVQQAEPLATHTSTDSGNVLVTWHSSSVIRSWGDNASNPLIT